MTQLLGDNQHINTYLSALIEGRTYYMCTPDATAMAMLVCVSYEQDTDLYRFSHMSYVCTRNPIALVYVTSVCYIGYIFLYGEKLVSIDYKGLVSRLWDIDLNKYVFDPKLW